MPTKKETNFEVSKYFNLPNPGLRSYLDNVSKGNDTIYSTPWVKGTSNDAKLKELNTALNDWMSHLTKLEEEWPTLYEFEKDLAGKVGPMSVQKPLSERIEDIEAYYKLVADPGKPVSDAAIKAALAKFKQAKGIRLRGEQRTVDLMKKSTNSGSPYFAKRRTVLKKTVPCTITGNHQILNGGSSEFEMAAVLGWRGQEGGPKISDVKQRVVWMFPFAANIEELRVYQPMIEVFQRFNLVPAWVSMESVDRSITKMFDTKGPDDLVMCTDFSKFDQHFNQNLQDCAKTILAELLATNSESRSWLERVFPVKYEIPLIASEDLMFTGKHGMGSGSGGTNADETLAHTALQYEAAIQVGKRLNPNSMCLGDDGVLTYPGLNVEDVMRSYTSHGLEMNPDKQYVSKHDCTYLRRWHHQNYRVDGVCVGVYSTARALGRLFMQERYYDPDVWGPKMVALRELSIIENCKYHPLREEFANWCIKRDKFRLGLDIPGFLENIEREAQEAIDLMPDFLGYTKSMVKDQTGLSEWWIVKYLKSLK